MRIDGEAIIFKSSELSSPGSFSHFVDHLGRLFRRIFTPERAGFYGAINDNGEVRQYTPEEQGAPKVLLVVEKAFEKLFGPREVPLVDTPAFSLLKGAKKGDVLNYRLDDRKVHLKIEGENVAWTLYKAEMFKGGFRVSGKESFRGAQIDKQAGLWLGLINANRTRG